MSQLPTGNLDDYASLTEIAPLAGVGYKQLHAWSNRNNNDFPEAVTLGRYKLYSKTEVIAWVKLWQKINNNMGRKHLNGQKGS